MKKLLILFLCFLSVCSNAQINATKADELFKSYILSKSNSKGCWIERYNGSGNVKLLYDETIVVPTNNYVYAVIYEPEQGWLDGYEYYFVSKNNGAITKQANTTCPIAFDKWIRIYGADFYISNQLFNFSNVNTQQSKNRVMAYGSSPTNVQSHNYAVIISGGASPNTNYIRYWNNCSALYQVLKKYYGYKDSDIYVLVSDGTDPSEDMNPNNGKLESSRLDLDGDGINDIEYAATKSNISTVFDILSKKVTSEDHLFIFTTDHGSKGAILNLWGERMTSDEFSKEVDKVNAGYMSILMIQCFSGGYIDKLKKNNRVIMTSASSTEEAWSSTVYNYGYFFMPWIAAVSGQDINGKAVNADANGDGIISMYEAFQYAKNNDVKAKEGKEHPQYSSVNEELGKKMTLSSPTIYNDNVINKSQTISDCYVGLKNVSITNNAKIVVDAIDFQASGSFCVELGSDFTVK